MNRKYVVTLTDEERTRLETLVSQGKAAARTIQRAWILLKADIGPAGPGWTDGAILLVDLASSTDRNIREAIRRLDDVQVPLLGLCVNRDRNGWSLRLPRSHSRQTEKCGSNPAFGAFLGSGSR